MKCFKLVLLFTLSATLGTLTAQDIHFSLFNMSPLTLNPALTGAYEGTARVGGIYRDQWASFLPNQFTTPSFFIDAPVIRGFRKNDWVGVGMLTVNDQAGTAKLKTTMNMLAVSYHFAMDKERKTMLTIGLQGGSVQRSIDLKSGDLIFGDETDLTGGTPGSSADRNLGDRKNYLDFNAGVMLRTRLSNSSTLEVGVGFNHLTQPNYSFQSGQGGSRDGEKRPFKTIAHATFQSSLTEKISIAPTALFQNTGGATEIALQGWAGYLLKAENLVEKQPEIKLNAGLGYRVGDAAQALAGVDYGPLRVALSYDINVSSLNRISNYQGGFEAAAWYVFKLYKKPSVKPAIICPQF